MAPANLLILACLSFAIFASGCTQETPVVAPNGVDNRASPTDAASAPDAPDGTPGSDGDESKPTSPAPADERREPVVTQVEVYASDSIIVGTTPAHPLQDGALQDMPLTRVDRFAAPPGTIGVDVQAHPFGGAWYGGIEVTDPSGDVVYSNTYAQAAAGGYTCLGCDFVIDTESGPGTYTVFYFVAGVADLQVRIVARVVEPETGADAGAEQTEVYASRGLVVGASPSLPRGEDRPLIEDFPGTRVDRFTAPAGTTGFDVSVRHNGAWSGGIQIVNETGAIVYTDMVGLGRAGILGAEYVFPGAMGGGAPVRPGAYSVFYHIAGAVEMDVSVVALGADA